MVVARPTQHRPAGKQRAKDSHENAARLTEPRAESKNLERTRSLRGAPGAGNISTSRGMGDARGGTGVERIPPVPFRFRVRAVLARSSARSVTPAVVRV